MSAWSIEAMGYVAAVLGTLCWVPQVSRTIRTRETEDLSLWTNLILLIAVTLWTIYGISTGSAPIALSNGAAGVMIGIILGYKLRYG